MKRNTFKHYITKPLVYIPLIILILIIIGGTVVAKNNNKPNYVLSEVTTQNLKQEISVTGSIKPASDASLAFEKSGRVRSVSVDVGAKVVAGQVLVSLENAELVAQLAQAEASVKAAQARLDELKQGGTPAEIEVEKIKLSNAQNEQASAQRSASETLQDAYVKIDDAIRNKIDLFFTNPRSNAPQFTLVADSQVKSSVEFDRVKVESILVGWESGAGSAALDLNTRFTEAKRGLVTIQTFLDRVATAVNALTPNASLTQTTIDAHKASVLSARTTVSTEISEVTSSEQALQSARNAVLLQESQLRLKETPARPEQVKAQEAAVEQAEANRLNIQAQLSKTILRSPISGVVTVRDVEVGEIVAANTPVVTVISSQKFKIEARVPESDISEIKLGNKSVITLDAYPEAEFTAEVIAIDPAETIVEGVPTYKVTLQFVSADERIKSGLTANVDIVTAEAPQALSVVSRSVSQKEGKKYVKVKRGEEIVEVEVVTGIRDSSGRTEIKSGLQAGDSVIIPGTK